MTQGDKKKNEKPTLNEKAGVKRRPEHRSDKRRGHIESTGKGERKNTGRGGKKRRSGKGKGGTVKERAWG